MDERVSEDVWVTLCISRSKVQHGLVEFKQKYNMVSLNSSKTNESRLLRKENDWKISLYMLIGVSLSFAEMFHLGCFGKCGGFGQVQSFCSRYICNFLWQINGFLLCLKNKTISFWSHGTLMSAKTMTLKHSYNSNILRGHTFGECAGIDWFLGSKGDYWRKHSQESQFFFAFNLTFWFPFIIIS